MQPASPPAAQETASESNTMAAAAMVVDMAGAATAGANDVVHRRLLESALETVPVGVLIADETGRIIHGNSRIEEIVRHPVLNSNDVNSYGEWVSFHADGRRVESREYPLSRVLRDGEEHSELDVHYQRGDGTRRWLRIIGRPVRNDDEGVIGASVAIINIDDERQLRETQSVLIAELNHRVKNAFSVVKSIVSQSLRKVGIDPELRETLDRRLDAYARAHSHLIGTRWDTAPVEELAQSILNRVGDGRIHMSGPDVSLPMRQGIALSMAFYELATNAWKYGALSATGGRVDLVWRVTGGEGTAMLELTWVETGGPPPVKPTTKGFGTTVIKRALSAETRGKIDMTYPPEGFRWRALIPISPNDGR